MGRPESLKIIGYKRGLIRGTKVKYRVSETKDQFMTLCLHIHTVLGNVRKISEITMITIAYILPWTSACDLRLGRQSRFCPSLRNTEESPFINLSWPTRIHFSHYNSFSSASSQNKAATKKTYSEIVRTRKESQIL